MSRKCFAPMLQHRCALNPSANMLSLKDNVPAARNTPTKFVVAADPACVARMIAVTFRDKAADSLPSSRCHASSSICEMTGKSTPVKFSDPEEWITANLYLFTSRDSGKHRRADCNSEYMSVLFFWCNRFVENLLEQLPGNVFYRNRRTLCRDKIVQSRALPQDREGRSKGVQRWEGSRTLERIDGVNARMVTAIMYKLRKRTVDKVRDCPVTFASFYPLSYILLYFFCRLSAQNSPSYLASFTLTFESGTGNWFARRVTRKWLNSKGEPCRGYGDMCTECFRIT